MKKDNKIISLPENFSPLRIPAFTVIKNIEASYQNRKTGSDTPTWSSLFKAMADGHKPHGFRLITGNPLLIRIMIFKTFMDTDDIPIALFSQMHREQIILEMISLETGIHPMDLKEGRLRLDDWPALTWATGRLASIPIFIENPRNIAEICSISRDLVKKFDIKALFIDNLQSFLSDTGTDEDPAATGNLAELSRGIEIPVFAGSPE